MLDFYIGFFFFFSFNHTLVTVILKVYISIKELNKDAPLISFVLESDISNCCPICFQL